MNSSTSISIRPFEKMDTAAVVRCLEGLCDYLTPLDPLKRIRRLPGWGRTYIHSLINILRRNDGTMFVAENDGKIVGIIAGSILKMSKLDSMSFCSKKSGRIRELYVHPNFRRKGLGKKLMEKMEEYFKTLGCDLIRIEVFEPNRSAHTFYNSLGYNNRVIDVIKEI